MYRRLIFALVRWLLILGAVLASSAYAQTYPTRPIRVIVPFPPGGVLDGLARVLAQRLQSSMSQPVIVENLAGASGNIGLAACARAPADGHTICVTTNDTISINPFLFKKMPIDPSVDLVPVQRLVWINGVVFASAGSGFRSWADAVAADKARPGSVNWGSFGIGSTSHLYMEWLNANGRSQFVHVPYKGSAPMLQGALGNEVQIGLLASGILLPHIKAGKLTPLAVVGNRRLEALPGVPALSEVGLSFYVQTWFGAFAPKGTPAPQLERLNAEITKVLADGALVRETLEPQGFRVATTSTPDFAEFLKTDRISGEMLVKAANVSID